MYVRRRGQSARLAWPSASLLSAGIALATTLFVASVAFFLTREVSPLSLLRSFTPGSQADYAFSLEQRVAPLRAAVQHGE